MSVHIPRVEPLPERATPYTADELTARLNETIQAFNALAFHVEGLMEGQGRLLDLFEQLTDGGGEGVN